jgi:hypothetical protein
MRGMQVGGVAAVTVMAGGMFVNVREIIFAT